MRGIYWAGVCAGALWGCGDAQGPGTGGGAAQATSSAAGGGPASTASSSTTSSSSTASSSSGGVGAPPECTVHADCPGPSPCATWACVGRQCVPQFEPAGTKLPDPKAGDCNAAMCDGAGQVVATPAPLDLPAVDDCHTAACSPGPVVTARATGAVCSKGLCKEGTCVEFLEVTCKCETADGGSSLIFGCAPGQPKEMGIDWKAADGSAHSCTGGTSWKADYCPSGTVCYGTLYQTHCTGVCVQ